MTTPRDVLAASEFMLLTTHRVDGHPVPSPVWVVTLDEGLGVWTVAGSAKTRRINRDGTVLVSSCDRVGVVSGPTYRGVARTLDDAGTTRVRRALQTKYSLTEEELLTMLQRIGSGQARDIGVAITLVGED